MDIPKSAHPRAARRRRLREVLWPVVQCRSPFAGYGPELARNVQLGGGTGGHFVGDGIPWRDLTEGERIIMIVPNGCRGSDEDSLGATFCLEHQGVGAGVKSTDQARPG